jgi:hypothetical protein
MAEHPSPTKTAFDAQETLRKAEKDLEAYQTDLATARQNRYCANQTYKEKRAHLKFQRIYVKALRSAEKKAKDAAK